MHSNVESFILDCEAVAFDVATKQILPFQVLSTRKRKDADESEIVVQVCLFAFDLLYLNGKSYVKEPFQVRRELLRQSFAEIEGSIVFILRRERDEKLHFAGQFQFAVSLVASDVEEIGFKFSVS